MATTQDVQIPIAAQVVTVKDARGRIEGYRGQVLAPDRHVLQTPTFPKKVRAKDRLQYDITDALALHYPVMIHYQDHVGLAFWEPGFGWCYCLSHGSSVDNQARIVCTGYDTREEIERALRRHMAQNIGGLLGSKLIQSAEDVEDHFAHDALQGGIAAWCKARGFTVQQAMEHRASNDEMRTAGDRGREFYRNYRRQGADPVDAWEAALDESRKHEQHLYLVAMAEQELAKAGA